MKTLNDLLTTLTVAASSNSDSQPLDSMIVANVVATIAGANPSAKSFISGTYDVKTFTFPALAGATDGDNIIFYDRAGDAWGIALDTTGGAAAAPNYAAWTAIPAGKKTYVDISGGTDAASVAALVESAVDALTGFTAVITTDDTAADGTMLFTQASSPGTVTAATPKNQTGASAGSITVANTTPGVASDVNVTANSISEVAHTFITGMKGALTTAGVLPAGLSATDYYAIRVDDDNYKFATSQANALLGTAVDITGYGTGTHTFTPATALAGSIKLQSNSEPNTLAANWTDIANSSTNFSAAGNLSWHLADIGYCDVRAVVTVTSGTVTVSIRINAKGA